MDNKNIKLTSIKNKLLKLSKKHQKPLKLIKTNRAECQHIKDEDDNFNLFDYLEDDFFSTEKAIKLKKEENKINEKERDKIFLNFMPAVKCLKRMSEVIEEEKNKNLNPNKSLISNKKKKVNNGNLYELFYSDIFNIDLLIIYLNKENNITIIDTLIELMYKKYINQSLFYLPQLCMFFNYKEYYSSIQSYLLDRCVDQIKFSLQITWLLNSFIEDETPLIKSDIYECLLQKIEETLVNGERNTTKLFNQYIQLQKDELNNNKKSNNNIYNKISNNFNIKKEKSFEMLPFLEKQSRSLYFNICNEFYSSLKIMCEDLKNYPKENDQRKNKLMDYIKNFNENFEKQRIDNEEYLLNYPSFFGVILPFNDSSSTTDLDSSLIIRIIPEQCFCFSTKARVPTKICAECIKVKELKTSEYFISNKKKNKTKICKQKSNNNFIKNLTILDTPNSNFNINKFVCRAFQRKQTTKVRQINLLDYQNINSNNNIFEFNRLSNRSQISEKQVEEEEKGEKLRKFLYNINKTIEEERENKISEEINNVENYKKNKENEKEAHNKIVDDFELLPDISEDLKNVFGKPMNIIKKEIHSNSPFKKFKTYKLVNFIAKANDDLRQEFLAMQLIKFFDKIFKEEKLPLYLRPYEILITSSSSGLLEFLENTCSIDGIKKKMATSSKNLCIFYKKYFKENFEEAQINFTRSLAAYSLVCYYLQIKDRHNGNILIDMHGKIIHIDFGFILGIAPGGINFEKAPFKLTKEYLEIMGGKESLYYQMYKDLMIKGMLVCKKYVDNFINIAEIMSKGSKMPCFDNKNPTDIFQKFRERFYPNKKDEDFINIVNDLVNWSYDNFRTNQYDNYQKLTNGILP